MGFVEINYIILQNQLKINLFLNLIYLTPCCIAAMASMFAGGKVAGIYPTDTVVQLVYKINHSGATIAVVEDLKKAKVLCDNAKDMPDLKCILVYGETYSPAISADLASAVSKTSINLLNWADFMSYTKGVSSRTNADLTNSLNQRRKAVKPGHCAALVYTSGTTGMPKAVMIAHDNIVSVAHFCNSDWHDDMLGAELRLLSYLPLSHIAGMLVDIALPMAFVATFNQQASVYFARNYDLKEGTIGDRLRFVKPTFFLGVPRVWEKIAEKLKAVGAAAPPIMRKISGWAKGKGLEHSRDCQFGGSGEFPSSYGLASVIHNKVKQKLGLSECKFAVTGAAPMAPETQEYFGSLGIKILEVFGMSESAGACTVNSPRCFKWGMVGYAPTGIEVAILDEKGRKVGPAKNIKIPTEAEQGEVCFRGRSIMMGYLANPRLGAEHVREIQAKNAEAIDKNGWLHSGDKGAIDKDGFFRITGRYKELIIGAGGENIAPVPIEDFVKSKYTAISNIMMVGDKRKYNVALITLKAKGATGEFAGTDELDGDALKVDSSVTTISGAQKSAKFKEYLDNAIKNVNANKEVCTNNVAKIQYCGLLNSDVGA